MISGSTSISASQFSPVHHIMSMEMVANLYPSDDPSEFNLGQALFLNDLIRGIPINLG